MLHRSYVTLAGVLALSASAWSDLCVSRWSLSDKGPHPSAITVSDVAEGQVLKVDLAALPKDAKVLRARLYLAEVGVEPREPAKTPADAADGCAAFIAKGQKPAGKPLPLAGPAFDCVDVTDAVRQWAGGTANDGLFIQSAPGWDKGRTWLEVAYEGQADKLPAQVQGVSVLHRAGQSFITWKDAEDKFGGEPATWGEIRQQLRADSPELRYRVYRHDKPIDAKSVADARLIAEVKPLSGFNINGWSMEKLINQVIFSNEDQGELGKYGAFDGWSMWSPQGGKLAVNRLAIEDDKPLPPGTGLFVHSPSAAGKAYYAVTVLVDGVENLSQFAGNVSQAIDEQPGPWAPVRQSSTGKEFGYDFRGRRSFYVQWAGPPLAPRDGMCFNWSVLLSRAALDKDAPKDRKLPVELYFHSAGMSYARPPVKFIENSIQIAPHDFPFSGWYGFNDAFGTLKSPAQGAVSGHTQKRLAAFMDWAKTQFPIDPSRIVGVGGDGAGLTALYQPDLFAYMLITGFQSDVLNPKSTGNYTAAWGPRSPDVKNDKGLAEWGWAELDYLLTGTRLPRALPKDQPPPAPMGPECTGWKIELPFFVIRGVTWGNDPGYVRGRGRFLYALQATGHGQYAHWAWGGSLTPPAKYTGLWQGIDFTNATPFPAIAYSTADKEGEGDGNCNARYGWKDVKDEADSFEASISGPPGSFDLTPRRCQKFKPKPGEKLSCTVKIVPGDPRSGSTTKPAEQTTEVAADANGIVTVKAVELVRGAGCVTVRLSRAQ